jgi:hypothetical protein
MRARPARQRMHAAEKCRVLRERPTRLSRWPDLHTAALIHCPFVNPSEPPPCLGTDPQAGIIRRHLSRSRARAPRSIAIIGDRQFRQGDELGELLEIFSEPPFDELDIDAGRFLAFIVVICSGRSHVPAS